MKRRIGMDADGVIRDFPNSLIRVYKKYYPHHKIKPLSEWRYYPLENYFPIGKEITKFYSEDHPEEVILEAKPYVGAFDFMSVLHERNYVAIVSNQVNEYSEHLTRQWLKLNNIPHDGISFEDKTKFEGDYILDDYTKNLERVLSKGNSTPICMNRQWNQDWEGLRVYSYQEFLAIVRNHY